jgi:uncharacterized repeat protein (TIGR01451 family)
MAALAAFCLGLAPLAAFSATTYTVTTTNDNGAGSFRQAIQNVNSGSSPGAIIFNISGPAPYSISLQSPLPAITNRVTIDGTSQPGFAGSPLVELDGASLGSGADGLYITAGASTVRGLAIHGFSGAGIRLASAGGNVIQGNFIGTDLTGTAALPNGTGIQIENDAPNNLIGGTNAGAGNVISGNAGHGLLFNQSPGNVIQGNFIGTDASGAANLGNTLDGIYLNNASSNAIGGVLFETANTIMYNGGAGVGIPAGTANAVRGNSIYANGGLGIDLGATGAQTNTPGGPHSGANDLQNYPVLTAVVSSRNTTFIDGRLNSAPNTTFQIDFYDSPVSDPSGHGQGKAYVGSASIVTDANGNASFDFSFAGLLPIGTYVSATATDPVGNTSEFSACQRFAPVNPVDLGLIVSAASYAQVGDQLSYSITVTNSGTNAASNVVLTDLLPASLNYVSAFPSQGVAGTNAGYVTCQFGTLPAGGAATLLIYVAPQTAGIFTNIASVTADQYNLNAANSTNLLAVNIYLPVPPVISTPPTSQLLNLGGLLNLVVGVLGPPGVRYQWRLNGDNIPGATNATYSVSTLLSQNAGSYTVMVSDEYGATTSPEALVSIANLLSLPASDNFASRGILLGLGATEASNVNATREPGEPNHAGVPGGKSVWFTWTPLLSGVATFSTAGSSFDTLLAVYTGNSLSNLTEVASDDDAGGYYTSQVMFNAVAGTTYAIAIDGAYGASGNIVLNSSLDLLGAPVPKITAQPNSQIVGFGGTANFSVQATGSGLSYQWYFNGAAISGATLPSLQVTNVQAAKVGLYTARVNSGSRSVYSHAASLQIALTDGVVNANAIARDKFQATVNAALIATPSKSSQFTTSRYSKQAAGASRGYTTTQVFSTYASGTQSGEPNHCDNPGGASSWTSVQAIDTGVMTIDTDGSSFSTILGVYTGNGYDFSSLTPVACDVGSGKGGTNSLVTFAATTNTIYYVAVDGVYGAYGTVVLNSMLQVPPRINSQPVSRTAAPGATVSLNTSVSGYTGPYCQWFFNGVRIPWATSNIVTITNLQSATAGTYQMIATNSLGTAVTVPACLLLNSSLHLDSCSVGAAGVGTSGNGFQMRLVGVAGSNYVLQASTDMVNWAPIATNTPATGLWNFTDGQSTNFVRRFYRAVPGQ